jgi:hypothetical protein
MHLKIIACEVACREIGYVGAFSPHTLDFEFLPVGHHDQPKLGHVDLQARVDASPPGRYDAILIGYGICNAMLNGLSTRHTRLVVPRAHDCITLFLGSHRSYQEVFDACPGTYYFTAGWMEFRQRKARANGEPAPPDDVALQMAPFSMAKDYAALVAKYGEENARYLMEVSKTWLQNYRRGMLIRFDFDQKLQLREKVAHICQTQGWTMDELPGDLSLLQRWVDGVWDEHDFLIVPPGHAVYPSHQDHIIEARPVVGGAPD